MSSVRSILDLTEFIIERCYNVKSIVCKDLTVAKKA